MLLCGGASSVGPMQQRYQIHFSVVPLFLVYVFSRFFLIILCFTYVFKLLIMIFFKIPATTTRILLNHFKWDKEKLMERFYDGDQEKLFAEARVINPFRQGPIINRNRASQSSLVRT